jgi:hypothetical protein
MTTTTDQVPVYNPKPIHQGATWSMSLTVSDENGAAKNLTGYTGKCQFREEPGGTVLQEVTVSITGATGKVDLSLTAAQTAAFEFTQCFYDVLIKSGGGTVTYLVKGTITVTPRISRDA